MNIRIIVKYICFSHFNGLTVALLLLDLGQPALRDRLLDPGRLQCLVRLQPLIRFPLKAPLYRS